MNGGSLRVLMTGGSSFTGCAMAVALARAGHVVCCTMTRPSSESYADALRRVRVERVRAAVASIAWGCRFGDDVFIDLAGDGRFDLICHHGADVTDYRSDHFDAVGALAANTHRLREVLGALRKGGGRGVVLTGTVFEGGEGAGSESLPHFSPYGLSKALTSAVFAYECRCAELRLGKFVIPNPFGPLEEPRFTTYLIRTWLSGETPCVRTPAYVRDNIHSSALAEAYVRFAERIGSEGGTGFERTSPSGYVESQGQFAQRFAREVGCRLRIETPLDVTEQTEFAEPQIRIGLDPVAMSTEDERAAWDALAEDYRQRFMSGGATA